MLITLEGIDGSGKSSVWEELQAEFPKAVFTCEPTDSWYGDVVRQSIGDDSADPLAELFLYTADHAAHLSSTVIPALDAGKLVISDRYIDSRFAYQATSLSSRLDDALSFVQSVHSPWTQYPDLTVFFDLDPETGASRIDTTDKFETISFLTDVKANYERVIQAEPNRFQRLDASEDKATVLENTIDIIRRSITSP